MDPTIFPKIILVFSRIGLLAILLFLLGALAVFAPPASAQQQTLTGWFTFIVADYPSEDGLASETTYVLTEDSGARHELLIDVELMRPLGGGNYILVYQNQPACRVRFRPVAAS